MLETVLQSVPLLFPFAYSAYESRTLLYYCGNTILLSQEGVQQGDPLGPLLFCLTIHPMVQQLQSRFKVFYMDDCTLGRNSYEVLEDLKTVKTFAKDLGLQLNCSNSSVLEVMAREVPGLQVLDPALPSCWVHLLVALKLSILLLKPRLINFNFWVIGFASCTLIMPFSFSDILLQSSRCSIYVLCTAPCFLSPFLEKYDTLLRDILSGIANVSMGANSVWVHAGHPSS